MNNPYADGTKVTLGLDLFARGFSQKELDAAYYDLTADPDQESLLFETASFQDIDDEYNPGELEMILESIRVKKFSQTASKMKALVRVLNKNAKKEITAEPAMIGKPRKSGMFATVTVQIPFTDGQVLSIVFHSPGGDERKILADDAIIAFRWLLNKRDITHAVSPEKGQNVSLEKISKRIMQITAKNSEIFQKKQSEIKAQKTELAETTTAIDTQEKQKQETLATITEVKAQAETADEDIGVLQARIEKLKEDNADLENSLEALKKKRAEEKVRNDAIDETKRLQALGAEHVPGLRFQDTEDAGRTWEYFQSGNLTQDQWDSYVKDLYKSGKATEPEIENIDDIKWDDLKELFTSAKTEARREVIRGEIKKRTENLGGLSLAELRTLYKSTESRDKQDAVLQEIEKRVANGEDDVSETESNADKIKGILILGDRPTEAPVGSLIFNAPRPIVGHEEWQGDFAHGRFYTAVDPKGDRADWMIEENRKMDAYVAEFRNKAETLALAKAWFRAEYPQYADKQEAREDSDEDYIRSFHARMEKIKTYGELKKVLAIYGAMVGKTGTEPEPEKETVSILPAKEQKGNPAKRAARILHKLKLEARAMKNDFHVKLKNGAWMDLSIETHDTDSMDGDGGKRIYFTQYIKEGGDLIIDSEMVFVTNAYTGYLKLAEIGYRGPMGEVRKTNIGRPESSWANMFSKNLIDQGYDKASPAEVETETKNLKQLIAKIKEEKDQNKKADLWYDADLNTSEGNQAVREMVMSLPAGQYKLHSREYGTNLVDLMYELYGKMPSNMVDEPLLLGLTTTNPEKVNATFTHDMDSVTINSDKANAPTIDDVKAWMRTNTSLDLDTEDPENGEIAYSTRQSGDVGNETPGKGDIEYVGKIAKKLTAQFPGVQTSRETVDEYVILTISGCKPEIGTGTDPGPDTKIDPPDIPEKMVSILNAFDAGNMGEADYSEASYQIVDEFTADEVKDASGILKNYTESDSYRAMSEPEQDKYNHWAQVLFMAMVAMNKDINKPDPEPEPGPDLDEGTLQIADDLLSGAYDDIPMDELSDLIEPIFDLDEGKYMDLMEKVDSYATELTKKKAQAA
jgi:hypothetical protein